MDRGKDRCIYMQKSKHTDILIVYPGDWYLDVQCRILSMFVYVWTLS